MTFAKNIEPGKVYYDESYKMLFLVLKKEDFLHESSRCVRVNVLWLTGRYKSAVVGCVNVVSFFNADSYEITEA